MLQVMYAGAQTQRAQLDRKEPETMGFAWSNLGSREMAKSKRPWSPPQIIWSALVAIVAWTAVGFSWFDYGFDWTTQVGASRMSNDAVIENLASICAAQARRSPDAKVALKQLESMQAWKRRGFIEEEHWAIMPGSDSAKSGVADLCAEKLLAT